MWYHPFMADNGNASATKADLLASEQRLDHGIDRMATQVVGNQAKIGEIGDKLAGMATKDDVNRILNAIDAFAGKAKCARSGRACSFGSARAADGAGRGVRLKMI